MEGHDKATAAEMCNIPAGQMSEEWREEIRELYKNIYVSLFIKRVESQIESQEELRQFRAQKNKVKKAGEDTFEKLFEEGRLAHSMRIMSSIHQDLIERRK